LRKKKDILFCDFRRITQTWTPSNWFWAQLKKIVFSRNFTNKLNDVLEITTAAFTEISVQNWENYCKHVINVEEENTRKDIVIDQEMDNFVIEASRW
jgi:hypothetical protein